MSEPKYKEVILETIDSLRKRKARPDLERICHMVERRHGITFEETEADLEKLVDSEIVIKVDYKGSTSYRNAAKWRKSHLGGSVLNSNDASRKLQSVVSALLLEALPGEGGDSTAGGERRGVSFGDIEKRLREEDEGTTLTCDHLLAALHREVEACRLEILPSGHYILGDTKNALSAGKNSPGASAADRARHASGGLISPTKRGRPSVVKRKLKQPSNGKGLKESKYKKLSNSSTSDGHPQAEVREDGDDDDYYEYDVGPEPSDSEREGRPGTCSPGRPHTPQAPSAPISSPSGTGSSAAASTTSTTPTAQTAVRMAYIDMESKCDYCLLTSECNRRGQPEELLFCKDCQAKAHPSCMEYSEDLAKRARNSPWQCIDCKTCYVCEDSGDPDAMLFCDACDKGYHMNCHNPPVLDKPKGKWVCSKCILELGIRNGSSLDGADVNEREFSCRTSNSSGAGSDNNNTSSVNKNTDVGGASFLPTPNDSPVYSHDPTDAKDDRSCSSSIDTRDQKPRFTLKIPTRHVMPSLPRLSDTLPVVVPDASEWSIDDVVQFFRDMGFIDQAEVFREQEIDGRSLLLMRRSDVLTGLSLKLGPALKIYTHVQRLQMRCDSSL